MIPSRIIEQHSASCKEQNFEPAGQRSLFRIIEVCGASMQKSQKKGLDNTTAEGTEAIDTIIEVAKGLVKKYGGGGWAGASGKVKVQKLMTHLRSWV